MSSEEEQNNKHPLKKTEAIQRKNQITDEKGNYLVKYNLILCLRSTNDSNPENPNSNFEGYIEILFTYYSTEDIFLNFSGSVHSIILNNKKIEISQKNHRIFLLSSNLLKNSINKVKILFSAKYSSNGMGMHHFIDPTDKNEYLYTQFCPFDCKSVFPVFDQPNIKATLKLSIIAPENWKIISNSKEKCIWKINKNTKKDDKDIEDINNVLSLLNNNEYEFLFKAIFDKNYNINIFDITKKISSYLYCICAGPFFCIKNPFKYEIPLRIFLRNSLKSKGENKLQFKITMTGMDFYKKFFGISYQFEKYDQIFCPEYNFGAMENVGIVTINENYLYRIEGKQKNKDSIEIFCNTILHELSHMWFGNLVTMNWWDDLWLNESFATIISYHLQSQLKNKFINIWKTFNNDKNNAYKADQKNTTHSVYFDINDTEQSDSSFDNIVYYKGSALLKQMLFIIGVDNFSKGLKEYFKFFKYNNTTFDDFINKMSEQLSLNEKNNFDIKNVSKKWLTEIGLTELEPQWEINDDNKIKKFNIIQKACNKKYNNLQYHFFNIKLIYDDEKDNKVFLIKVLPQEITEISNLVGVPAPKGVFMNFGDYGYFKEILDNTSFNYFKNNLMTAIKDNLSRQMFYNCVYNLVRDAKISSLDYLNLVLKYIVDENDTKIFTTALNKVSELINNYIPKKLFSEYSDKFFDLMQLLIIKYKKNDINLLINLLDYLVSFANSEINILKLKEWLVNDKLNLKSNNEEFQLDKDILSNTLRFKICEKIFTLNSINSEEKYSILKKMQEIDKNSDRAIREEYTCKAALPDPKIKEEVWNLLTENNNGISLKNLQAYMFGFQRGNNMELVEKYVKEKFFDVIIKLKKADYFFLRYFIPLCGPIYYVEDEIIGKIEETAEKVKDSDSCYKLLMELGDDIKRFKKAQDLIK